MATSAAHAGVESKRLVYLGLERGPAVPDEVHLTLDEAVRAQVGRAAVDRGFVEVQLAQSMGAEALAASCRERACRLEIGTRLKATHLLRGRLTRERRGYAVHLFLENATTGAFLFGVRTVGDVPTVRGELVDRTSELLEQASPKDEIARARLAKTARAYLAKGRADDAARTFQRAADLSPFHPDAPRLQLERLVALDRAGQTEAAWQSTLLTLETWGPRSAWALASIGDPAAVASTLRERLLAIGSTAHAAAQQIGDDDKRAEERDQQRALATRAWETFLAYFDDAPEAGEVELYLAELRYAERRYEDAATGYASALDSDLAKDKKIIAATSMVLARERALLAAAERGDVSMIDLDGETRFRDERVELTPWESDLIAAVDRVLVDFEKVEDAPRFAYRAAHLLAARGQTVDACARFADVAKRWPRQRAGVLAKQQCPQQ